MIVVECSARGADRIHLTFANGWSAALWPRHDGLSLCLAWASHEDRPRAGGLNVVSGEPLDADGVLSFLSEIAGQPQVNSHAQAI